LLRASRGAQVPHPAGARLLPVPLLGWGRGPGQSLPGLGTESGSRGQLTAARRSGSSVTRPRAARRRRGLPLWRATTAWGRSVQILTRGPVELSPLPGVGSTCPAHPEPARSRFPRCRRGSPVPAATFPARLGCPMAPARAVLAVRCRCSRPMAAGQRRRALPRDALPAAAVGDLPAQHPELRGGDQVGTCWARKRLRGKATELVRHFFRVTSGRKLCRGCERSSGSPQGVVLGVGSAAVPAQERRVLSKTCPALGDTAW